jgi:hypothetical protein
MLAKRYQWIDRARGSVYRNEVERSVIERGKF